MSCVSMLMSGYAADASPASRFRLRVSTAMVRANERAVRSPLFVVGCITELPILSAGLHTEIMGPFIKSLGSTPGQYFGEMSFIDGAPTSARVVANAPTTLRMIAMLTLDNLSEVDPTFGARLYVRLPLSSCSACASPRFHFRLGFDGE